MKVHNHFDITGLHYFSAVAEERSFSRAAARLRIAQPAVSRRVKALEDDLEVQLLYRHARGVDLTEAGESLLSSAYALFRHIGDLRENAMLAGDTPSGVVVLGVLPTPGEYIVPRLIAKAKLLYPDIRFRIVEGYSGDLLRMLINQEINMAIMHALTPHSDVDVEKLLLDYMCIVGPAGSLKKKSYTFKEAATFPLILQPSPNLARLRLDQIAEERGIELNVVMGCHGFWVTKSMIREGLGFSMVTFGSVVTDLENGLLDVAPIEDPAVPWPLVVAVRADQASKLSLTAIKKLAAEIVTELRSKDIWRQIPGAAD